jgi:hypothetical protein
MRLGRPAGAQRRKAATLGVVSEADRWTPKRRPLSELGASLKAPRMVQRNMTRGYVISNVAYEYSEKRTSSNSGEDHHA